MDKVHARYRFSVTFCTDGPAVLYCLRALCQWAQLRGGGSPSIGRGGSGEKESHRGRTATLRFTSPDRRQRWLSKAQDLLAGKRELVSMCDDDPAHPHPRS